MLSRLTPRGIQKPSKRMVSGLGVEDVGFRVASSSKLLKVTSPRISCQVLGLKLRVEEYAPDPSAGTTV